MYCLKCRRVIETENITIATSTNGRLMRRSCDMMSEGCDTMYGRVRYECLGLDTSAIQESCHDIL